ncbi:Mu-like prophage major head subunit gpT family protein [Phototrophicus methaneseepsis]|uniref:Mu-like prophage major head subunit gpT family protein n=1 Tax=Phototrophicus methaneseepsis TaxID=2710758 RepID=A0A7S8E630_9CHLR|nr:Mu-like prophage major head subunit gpT family protein [Phototrophicus methaneseepsis]QPC81063.1 Mu-like prophage major head subunit gpT family protein [Phototrophicus methaneseepsis]
MVQHSGNFSELVDFDPVLTEIFFQKYAQIPQILLPTIYAQRESRKAKETDMRIGSFPDPQPWDGHVFYDDAERDSKIEYVHGHLTLGFKVDIEMREDMQYDGIFDRAANLGQSFARKIVKDESSPFNNAFSSSYPGYDSKALCATDHPRSETDATAVSNYLGAKALTSANLEDAIIQLESLGDDRGEETNAMANVLLVGRQQRKTALELTSSELTPESANNAINVHNDLQTLVHPMISGKKWFVMDREMARMVLKWYWRVRTSFGVDDDKSNTLMRSYFGRNRYSYGWSDFRFVVGSNPA